MTLSASLVSVEHVQVVATTRRLEGAAWRFYAGEHCTRTRSTVNQNPPPPDLAAVVDGAVPGVDGTVVIGWPDGLSTHQVPKESLTPWPAVVPDPVSLAKVYKG